MSRKITYTFLESAERVYGMMSGRSKLGWLLLGIYRVFELSRRAVKMDLIRALAKWGWRMSC